MAAYRIQTQTERFVQSAMGAIDLYSRSPSSATGSRLKSSLSSLQGLFAKHKRLGHRVDSREKAAVAAIYKKTLIAFKIALNRGHAVPDRGGFFEAVSSFGSSIVVPMVVGAAATVAVGTGITVLAGGAVSLPGLSSLTNSSGFFSGIKTAVGAGSSVITKQIAAQLTPSAIGTSVAGLAATGVSELVKKAAAKPQAVAAVSPSGAQVTNVQLAQFKALLIAGDVLSAFSLSRGLGYTDEQAATYAESLDVGITKQQALALIQNKNGSGVAAILAVSALAMLAG